jgi:hypothetical protein
MFEFIYTVSALEEWHTFIHQRRKVHVEVFVPSQVEPELSEIGDPLIANFITAYHTAGGRHIYSSQ